MKGKLKKYPKTKYFECVDTIGVPHPYCITPKHVGVASDKYCGRLSPVSIKDTEDKHGPSCGMKGCNLLYKEHKQAVLIRCKVDNNKLLQKYVNSILELLKSDNFEGVAFIKNF